MPPLPPSKPTNGATLAVDLSIIIVNWNSADYVRNCLRSIYAHTRELCLEIIVVDSASFDGCGEMLAREFPEVVFVQSPENIGFARSNNLGCEHARGHTLLFLNPDTELCGPAINTLFQALHTLPQAGAVGAKLLNSDQSVQTSCIQSFPTLLNQALDSEYLRRRSPRSRLWGMAPLFSGNGSASEVEVISGACLMIRRELFQQIGRFSQEYFMYSDDLDLCHKVQRAGLKNYFVPEAVIIHHGGGSSQQARSEFSTVMMRDSVCRFLTKTRGRGYGSAYRATMALSAAGRLLLLCLLAPIKCLEGIWKFARSGDRAFRGVGSQPSLVGRVPSRGAASDSPNAPLAQSPCIITVPWRKSLAILKWSLGLAKSPWSVVGGQTAESSRKEAECVPRASFLVPSE